MIAQLNESYIKHRATRIIPRLITYLLFEGRPVTTKGQWINPIIFSLFSIEKKLPQLKKVHKPIFIAGAGRSGTTMLGTIMSLHKSVGFLNEPKAMWHSIFPQEDVIGSYGKSNKAKYNLTALDATPEIRRNAHRLFGAYLRATVSERIVDKYPEHIFRIPFVSAIFPDSKFIFLVRNGWDTCVSVAFWSKRFGREIGGETHDWWGINNRKWHLMVEQLVPNDDLLAIHQAEISGFKDHINMAAVEWILTMRYGLRQMRNTSSQIHLLRYEDLISKPGDELRKLMEYCELSDDPVVIKYAQHTARLRHVSATAQIDPLVRPAFEQTMLELGY